MYYILKSSIYLLDLQSVQSGKPFLKLFKMQAFEHKEVLLHMGTVLNIG